MSDPTQPSYNSVEAGDDGFKLGSIGQYAKHVKKAEI